MATFTFELRDNKGANPLKECFVHQVEQTRINAQNQGLKNNNLVYLKIHPVELMY